MTGHVLAWLLIGSALPRLAASTGATILLAQPVFALALSAALLGERPTLLQLAGCAVVVLVVGLLARHEHRPGPARHPSGRARSSLAD